MNKSYKMTPEIIAKYKWMVGACPEGAREIDVSDGLVAWVSDEDHERVSARDWHSKSNRRAIYGISTSRDEHKDGRKIYLHVYILGRSDGMLIDHKNGNTLDCRRSNLRHVTPSVNCHNYHGAIRGVTAHRTEKTGRLNGKWRASITICGKYKNLGLFGTRDEAITARTETESQFRALS